MSYDGDVKLSQTESGGEITLDHGQPEMDPGLATAVYLSLFAGPYWGNSCTPANEALASKLAEFSRRILTNQSRLDIEEACRSALAWMLEEEIASEIAVEARIISTYGVEISVTLGEGKSVKYSLNWRAEEAQ